MPSYYNTHSPEVFPSAAQDKNLIAAGVRDGKINKTYGETLLKLTYSAPDPIINLAPPLKLEALIKLGIDFCTGRGTRPDESCCYGVSMA